MIETFVIKKKVYTKISATVVVNEKSFARYINITFYHIAFQGDLQRIP